MRNFRFLILLIAVSFIAAAQTDSSLVQEEDSVILPFKDDPSIAVLDSLIHLDAFRMNADDIREDGEDVPKVILPHDSIIIQQLNEMDQNSPLTFTYNKHVQRYIETYATRRTEQMERMLGLAELYFPLFEESLDKYQVPLEVKYLAIVESALNPRARSRVGTTGLWQFMYSTTRIYDLKVSSYVDERSNPVRSTEAACQYLVKLHSIGRFGITFPEKREDTSPHLSERHMLWNIPKNSA